MGEELKTPPSNKFAVTGAHAILGMDIVSFSTLKDEDQLAVIKKLMRYIREALAFHSIREDAYRWSPAGDGGYITFVTDASCRAAVDVAFSIFEKVNSKAGNSTDQFHIRAALHAGVITEDYDLGRDTNIWGIGINTTARVLSISETSQLLVSKQYYDAYLKDQREQEFHIGEAYWRTVKHGVRVEVMNISRAGVCLGRDEAVGKRWRYIGGLWRKMVQEYESLIGDAMHSGEPVAAIAAAKFLLALGEQSRADQLCKMLTSPETQPGCDFPPQNHKLFSVMPADVLLDVIRKINPRLVQAGEVICQDGIQAESCFFPVAGNLVVEVPGRDTAAPVKKGNILGEFSLWVSNLSRTATIKARDVGLVLELSHRDFSDILESHPDVADVVYGIIKKRIVENVWNSSDLFPGLATALNENVSGLPARCEKTAAGTKLDLSSNAYVLLTGRVRIRSFNERVHELEAEGRFDRLVVVGITSRLGMPDGPSAEVVEEMVAVKISHNVLLDLQQKHPAVARAWCALCGMRLAELGFTICPPAGADAAKA